MPHSIAVTRIDKSRLTEELRENSPFGTNYSDHMFVADYSKGEWRDARVVPYGPMSLSPALTALHYGQSLFEGFKAHRQPDGRVALFRPMANHAPGDGRLAHRTVCVRVCVRACVCVRAHTHTSNTHPQQPITNTTNPSYTHTSPRTRPCRGRIWQQLSVPAPTAFS